MPYALEKENAVTVRSRIPGNERDAHVLRAIEERLLILFVGEDPEIEGLCQVGDLLQFFAAEDDPVGLLPLLITSSLVRGEARWASSAISNDHSVPSHCSGTGTTFPRHADGRLSARVLRILSRTSSPGLSSAEGAVDDLLGSRWSAGSRRRGRLRSRFPRQFCGMAWRRSDTP